MVTFDGIMERVSGVSKLQQAQAHISGLIRTSKPGDKLPSESTLAADAGVSRVTMRDALDKLWTQGKIVRRWGAGTFVAERAPGPGDQTAYREVYVGVNGIPSLPADVSASGHVVDLASFSVTRESAPDWVRTELGSDDPVWLVRRCFSIDGAPAVLIRDYLPIELDGNRIAPTELSDPAMDLPRFLKENGEPIAKQESTLDAVLVDAESAELLAVAVGSPLVRGRQRGISDRGTVVSCAEILYRNDTFHTVLVRAISS